MVRIFTRAASAAARGRWRANLAVGAFAVLLLLMRVERRIGQVGLVAVAADIITAFDVVLATALASLCLIVAHWISIADGTAVFVRIVRATVGLHRLLRLLH